MIEDIQPEAQRRRQLQYLEWMREADATRFDADGNFIGGGNPPDWRDCWLHGLALFGGNQQQIALANRLLENGKDDGNDFGLYFYPLLDRLYGDRISVAAREKIDSAFRKLVDHACVHLFRYTENCGLLNCYGLLEAAERYDRPECRAKAILFLEAFAQYLADYGACREYFSVNYWGGTLQAAATIRQFVADPRAVELAARIENALWHEAALVWHPNVFYSAGPSGRSYIQNQIPSLTSMHAGIWTGLGDRACPSPHAFGFFDKPESTATRAPEWRFCQIANSGDKVLRFTPPEGAFDLCVNKTFPYEMRTTALATSWREHEIVSASEAECGLMGGWYARGGTTGGTAYVPSTVTLPGGPIKLSCYMMPDWGLGAATRKMIGQSSQLFACWRRRAPVQALGDIRTLFPRYVVNNSLEENFDQEIFGELPEQGRGGAMQSGPLGLAWYAGGEVVTKGIKRLRTCVIIPSFYGHEIDETWIGERRLPEFAGSAEQAEWIFLRDGSVYVGVRPLAVNQHGSRRFLEVKRVGKFRVLTFANYDGAAREFHPALLRQTGGGFVVCMGSEMEFPGGFESFRRSCEEATVTDELYQSQRHLHVCWRNREAETIYDMQGDATLWIRTEQGIIANAR